MTKKGIEVDKAKVDLIASLPVASSVKQVRSFLGHAGFSKRFIKDLSKVAHLLTNVLTKDAPFMFNESCVEAFEKFRSLIVSAPIVQPLNFLPFEIMCDAFDSAIGAVLGQRGIECFMSFTMLVELLLMLKRIILLLRKSC